MPIDPALEAALQALEAEVARDADVNNSAVTVIQRLLADLEATGELTPRVQAVVDTYKAQTDALASSVAAVPGPSGGTGRRG